MSDNNIFNFRFTGSAFHDGLQFYCLFEYKRGKKGYRDVFTCFNTPGGDSVNGFHWLCRCGALLDTSKARKVVCVPQPKRNGSSLDGHQPASPRCAAS